MSVVRSAARRGAPRPGSLRPRLPRTRSALLTGLVSIALVVFAMWRPGRALLGALLFALFDAYQLRLQTVIGKAVPYQLFLMLPYLLSILAVVVMARRARVPQALMQPYVRGER